MKPLALPILLLLLIPFQGFSQKEIVNWQFGNGLRFSNGSITNVSAMTGFAISDSAGNVLFSTTGNSIYDKNNQPMAGSPALTMNVGRNIYSIRKPGSASEYYIFFIEFPNIQQYAKLKYHMVDMSLNGGLGQVTSSNVLVRDSVSFAFTAIRQPGTDNFWLLTQRPYTKAITSALVTSSSLNASTIVNTAGTYHQAVEYQLYDMRSSHNGKIVAITSHIRNNPFFGSHTEFIEVYNFDAATGALSYRVRTTANYGAYFNSLFQVEFSADNRVLYVLNTTEVGNLQPCGLYSSLIRQYNLCYTDSVTFSRNMMYNNYLFPCSMLVLGRLQMGPDKKIYFPQTRTNKMGRIEYPQRIGTSAMLNYNVHTLNASSAHYLPPFYHYYVEKAVKNNIVYKGGCHPAPLTFEITNDTIASIQWNFGDPASGAANTSSLLKPDHVFSSPGFYTVTAELYNSAGQLFETVTDLIEIKDPGKRLLYEYPMDTTFCNGGVLKLKLNVVNGIFRWSRKLNNITSLLTVGDSIEITSSGMYYVEMRQNDCNGCVMRDSINVNVLPAPNVNITDRTLCSGDSTMFFLSNPMGTRYLWSTGDTTPSIYAKQAGIYWVRAEINGNGCVRSDTAVVTEVPNAKFSFPPDTTLCTGQTLLLQPGIPNASYRWQDGSTATTFLVTQPGTYWARVLTFNGCSGTDTISVGYVNAATVNLGADTSLCMGDSVQLQVNVPNTTVLWSTGQTGPSIKVFTTGDYWVRVDNGSCTITDTVKVTFNTPPVFNLGVDTALCAGERKILRTGISNALHMWQNGSIADTFTVTQPGLYWVQVSKGGCRIRDSITVTYKASPPVNLGNDTSICINASMLLNAFHPDIAQYRWQDSSTQPWHQVQQPGIYSVQVQGSNGCFNRDSIRIDAIPLPVFSLGKDTTLCEQELLALNVTVPNAQYAWNTGGNTGSLIISQPGWYWLDVKANGCTRRDSIQVLYKPAPVVNLGADTTICEGISLQLNASNANASYIWQDNSSGAIYNVTRAGNYHVTVSMNGCVRRDTIKIDYLLKPVFTLGNDIMLCEGHQVMLDPKIRVGNFLWQDGTTAPVLTVNAPGTYQLTVGNQCGTASDLITVSKGLCRLVMPNAFTPNNDNINDLFRIKYPEFIKTFSLSIYNRWGQLIFHTIDPYKGWNGTFNAIPQPSGGYVWIVSLTDLDGNKESGKGTVTLLR